ncbi:MAG TPA: hypothetical protein VLC12_05140, partial [Terriglobales bacterium]|nr:hypothetical protein [Terriglobales bacterium]
MRKLLSLIALTLLTASAAAQSSTPSPAPSPTASEPGQPGAPVQYPRPNYGDLLPRFSYDSRSGIELRETNVEKRGSVRLIELNYAGDSGDRVPAYLLIPPGNGPFPAIIWGHWLMKGSPLANKDEFLEEALVLAEHSGVVSVLIDAPQVRHDFVEEKGLMESVKQQSEAGSHQVIDLRRAVDLLLLRRDVDRKRIAYVGHSWDAHVGAILAGVEDRICCYVLMASGYSDEEELFASKAGNDRLAVSLQQLILLSFLQVEITEQFSAMKNRLGKARGCCVDDRFWSQQQLEDRALIST